MPKIIVAGENGFKSEDIPSETIIKKTKVEPTPMDQEDIDKVNKMFERRSKGLKYPWGEWFSHKVFCITKGEDFDCELMGMYSNIKKNAKARGIDVSIRIQDLSIYIKINSKGEEDVIQGQTC